MVEIIKYKSYGLVSLPRLSSKSININLSYQCMTVNTELGRKRQEDLKFKVFPDGQGYMRLHFKKTNRGLQDGSEDNAHSLQAKGPEF